MVYKIRNKGFVNWKGAAGVRATPMKKTDITPYMDQHVTMQTQLTRFTGMRIMHNYRNISRACKQFMMGDRFLEQLMILNLKEHYFAPMKFEAPIENVFYMVSALSSNTFLGP